MIHKAIELRRWRPHHQTVIAMAPLRLAPTAPVIDQLILVSSPAAKRR